MLVSFKTTQQGTSKKGTPTRGQPGHLRKALRKAYQVDIDSEPTTHEPRVDCDRAPSRFSHVLPSQENVFRGYVASPVSAGARRFAVKKQSSFWRTRALLPIIWLFIHGKAFQLLCAVSYKYESTCCPSRDPVYARCSKRCGQRAEESLQHGETAEVMHL